MFNLQITNLLYDLGTNASEIARNMPKMAQPSKEKKAQAKKRGQNDGEKDGGSNKKAKIEVGASCQQIICIGVYHVVVVWLAL